MNQKASERKLIKTTATRSVVALGEEESDRWLARSRLGYAYSDTFIFLTRKKGKFLETSTSEIDASTRNASSFA